MKKEIEIIICGDLCPTKDTLQNFDNDNSSSLFNDIIPVFNKADFVLANLEFVLIDNPKPIKKAGPILSGKTDYIKTLKKAGIQTVSLANNHIKDCGEDGVLSTIEACKNYGVETFGAGKNLLEAKKHLIKEVQGWKIGIAAFAEQEFNVADNTEAGANYLDPYEDFDSLRKLKEQVDYLIVLYHGGVEYYKYPSPILQKKCRKFIEAGADLVTCQHSHCIGTNEKYLDGTIVYGQGNTLFGYRNENSSWNDGLLIKINLSENSKELQYIPIEAVLGGVKLKDKTESEELLNIFDNDSKDINNTVFIQEKWHLFCKKNKALYFPLLYGLGRVFIHSNRMLNNRIIKYFYSKKRLRTTLNLVRCEAHNEVVLSILKGLINKTK